MSKFEPKDKVKIEQISKTTRTAPMTKANIAAQQRNAEKIYNKGMEKMKRIRAFRKEASRKAAMANKRIARLENAGLKDSPAYQAYIESGGGKFSVRGKTHRQVQAEVARLDRLLNAETSTVRGAVNVLKKIAERTKVPWNNMSELKQNTAEFFRYVNIYNEYASTVLDAASAIGYKQVWDAASVYIKESRGTIDDGELDIQAAIDSMTKSIEEFKKKERIAGELFELKTDK